MINKLKSKKIIVYIDKILIYTDTRQENIELLEQVLNLIQSLNMKVTLSKIQLVQRKRTDEETPS